MALGAPDTPLRTATRFATDRRLYGRTVVDIPHARSTLAEAFVDLLACDSLTMVAARACTCCPGRPASSPPRSIPSRRRMLSEAVEDLWIVLGARYYVRRGRVRDLPEARTSYLPVLSLGHAGSAACQLTMLPQLLMLARRSWLTTEPAEPALFRLSGPLPPLRYDQLAVISSADPLAASLLSGADAVADGELRAACAPFVAALRDLRVQLSALAPRDVGPAAGPDAFALTARYAAVLAPSACLNVWRTARTASCPTPPGCWPHWGGSRPASTCPRPPRPQNTRCTPS